jgi:hypothetical protein
MRILFCYTGLRTTTRIRKDGSSPAADLIHLPTTHMSEVGCVLIAHWMRELGHHVTFLVNEPDAPGGEPQHFPVVAVEDLAASDYDVLLVFKIHGLNLVSRHRLFQHGWRKVIAWLDTPGPERIVGPGIVRITGYAWGTPELLAQEEDRFPAAEHALCEHATVFVNPPDLEGPTELHGLYAGRLPPPYLQQVMLAAETIPMEAYGLWIELNGEKVLLRPGQVNAQSLLTAQQSLPPGVHLHAAVNMVASAPELSRAAFGLCPATWAYQRQVSSASKFYDYLALGLPVVLADNVPEAVHVQENGLLGVLYSQADRRTLDLAIRQAIGRTREPSWSEKRKALQDWVFGNATWKHRACSLLNLM